MQFDVFDVRAVVAAERVEAGSPKSLIIHYALAYKEFLTSGWTRPQYFEIDDGYGNILDQRYEDDTLQTPLLNAQNLFCAELPADMILEKYGPWTRGERLFCVHDTGRLLLLTDHVDGGRLLMNLPLFVDHFNI